MGENVTTEEEMMQPLGRRKPRVRALKRRIAKPQKQTPMQLQRQNKAMTVLLKDIRAMLGKRGEQDKDAKEYAEKIDAMFKGFKADAPPSRKTIKRSNAIHGVTAGTLNRQELKKRVLDGLDEYARHYGEVGSVMFDVSEAKFKKILDELKKTDFDRYFILSENIDRIYRYFSTLVPEVIERIKSNGVSVQFIIKKIKAPDNQRLFYNRLAAIKQKITKNPKDMLEKYPILYEFYHLNYLVEDGEITKRHDGKPKNIFPLQIALEIIKYIKKYPFDEMKSKILQRRRDKKT